MEGKVSIMSGSAVPGYQGQGHSNFFYNGGVIKLSQLSS